MEFVLLMCLPIVIMTQMPSFDQRDLPLSVVIALSVIIIFPVILMTFFLWRLMGGLWKEFKQLVSDVGRSTPNLFSKSPSLASSPRSISSNVDQPQEEDGPYAAAVTGAHPVGQSAASGLAMVMADRMKMNAPELQNDADSEGGATGTGGTLPTATGFNGENGVTVRGSAGVSAAPNLRRESATLELEMAEIQSAVEIGNLYASELETPSEADE